MRANVQLGRLDATDAEVGAAVARALAGEFVPELPDGLDTAIGERGAHCLSTIRSADLIVTLAEGRVAEVGTYPELLATYRCLRPPGPRPARRQPGPLT